MNTDSFRFAGHPLFVVWRLLAIACLSCVCAANGIAQDTSGPATDSPEARQQENILTTENLIGTAVSLSNRSYPEIDSAIQRFRNGDAQGAIDYLNQAKEKYPKLPPTDITLAKMQLAARNGNAVRFLLERVVVEHPDDPEAYLLLADQAFMGGRTTEALALFEMADPLVQEFNENEKRKQNFTIRVLAGRSAVAERRGQWDEAFQLLNKWIEADPDSAAARQRLGVALFKLKKNSDALKQFNKARELNPDVGHPFVVMGQLFSQEGDKVNAKKAYEKAYKENMADAKVAQAYAEWLIQEDDLDEAQAVAAKLRELTPDSVVALLLDGIVAQMQGNTDRAEQALQKVLSLDPSNATATNILALLLIMSDDNADRERALRYAQVNAERFENSVQANITLGWVLYKLKRGAEATAALQKGAQAGQLQADSAYLVAKIMSEQEGQREKAAQALEQVLGQKTGLFLFRREAQKLLEELKGGATVGQQ
jgi:tetratricopeptide (TPR) repeat protein